MPSEQNIFEQAAAIADEVERARYLDQACGADLALRARIEHELQQAGGLPTFGALEERGLSQKQPGGSAGETTKPFPGAPGIGEQIGTYRIREKLGEGGFGLVYLAEQFEPVRRKVALKVIKPGMDTREVIVRFEAERQALAMMDHPNIARVLDAGTTSAARPYFVMELVRGVTITQYCDEAKLGIHQRLQLFNDVCRAVQHAHQKGIIHRDLKPGNILVTQHDGRPVVKVIDFGVAKALHQKLGDQTVYTRLTQMLGTPLYMSPEQAEMSSLDIDTRSDIYSLGVLLYELLTGSTPFDRKRLASAALDEIRRIIREEEPPRPSTRLSESGDRLPSIAAQRHSEPARLSRLVRGDLDWIAMKCLEKDRNRRYQTANGLSLEILRYLAGEAVLAAPPSRVYRIRKFVRRNRGPVIAASLIGLTLIGGIIGTSFGLYRAEQQRELAEQATKRESERAEAERKANEKTKTFSQFLLTDVLGSAVPKGFRGGLGKDVKLREAVDAAVDQIPERFKGKPDAEAYCRQQIARAYKLMGDLRAAETQLRMAITCSKPRDKETIQTWELQLQLADVLLQTEHVPEAELLARHATSRLAEINSEEGKSLSLEAKQVLARSLAQLGKFPEAQTLYQELSTRMRERAGPNDLGLSVVHVNYGNMLMGTGRFREGEIELREALRIFKDVHGELAHTTLTVRNSLGQATFEQRKFRDTLTEMREVLRGRQAILEPDHVHTLQTQSIVGNLLRLTGEFEEARKLLQDTIAVQRRQYGENSPMVMETEYFMVHWYLDCGDWESALTLARDSLQRARANLDPGALPLLEAEEALGTSLIASGLANEAIELTQRMCETRRHFRAQAPQHLANATLLSSWALVEAGRINEARPLLSETDAIFAETGKPATFADFCDVLRATAEPGSDAESAIESAIQNLDALIRDDRANGSFAAEPRRLRAFAVKYLINLYADSGKTDQQSKWKSVLDEIRKTIPIH